MTQARGAGADVEVSREGLPGWLRPVADAAGSFRYFRYFRYFRQLECTRKVRQINPGQFLRSGTDEATIERNG